MSRIQDEGSDKIQRNFYKEVLFGSRQTEQEYSEERGRFAQLLSSECGVAYEDACDMYDTRKTLSLMEAKYAGGALLTRDDFLLTLSLGRKLLGYENIDGVIPFIVRNRKKHPDFSAIQHHPRYSLLEIISQRFIDTEEMMLHEQVGLEHEAATDVQDILDFCIAVHNWNTDYYRQFPAVGVIFSKEISDEKKFRAGEQANYLAWWRGLPYEICQTLMEFRLLDTLGENTRSDYLKKLCEMGLEELFDESYFEHRKRPPEVPRIAERPPRVQPAEQLLRMLVGEYGREPVMEEIKSQVFSNTFSTLNFIDIQLAQLKEIFSPSEE